MTWRRSTRLRKQIGLIAAIVLVIVIIFAIVELSVDGDRPTTGIFLSPIDQLEFQRNISRNSLRESILPSKLEHPANSDPTLGFEDKFYSEYHDFFDDIEELFTAARTQDSSIEYKPFEYVIIRTKVDKINPTLADVMGTNLSNNATTLERLHMAISKQHMYGENDPIVFAILHEMAMVPIVKILPKDKGTQLKLTVVFQNGIKAIFKPMRYGRDVQTKPEHYYFSDFERHNSEIASFHLDKILGFRRAFPVTGRKLNVTSEIYDLAYNDLRRTFFKTQLPYNKTCFYGSCKYYCDTHHAVCGEPDMLEGSLVAFMPEFQQGLREKIIHPWRRSYNAHRKAEWELDDDYCENVREHPPYNRGRRLLDLMDLAVFDFLIGNQDRHHYEVMQIFGNETTLVHVDHGRGFGRPFYDDLSILTPLEQCCLIRESTLQTLLKFHNGPKRLSQTMRESMLSDPVAPILWEPHLAALDRRIPIILNTVRSCIDAIESYQKDNPSRSLKSKLKAP